MHVIFTAVFLGLFTILNSHHSLQLLGYIDCIGEGWHHNVVHGGERQVRYYSDMMGIWCVLEDLQISVVMEQTQGFEDGQLWKKARMTWTRIGEEKIVIKNRMQQFNYPERSLERRLKCDECMHSRDQVNIFTLAFSTLASNVSLAPLIQFLRCIFYGQYQFKECKVNRPN